MSDLRPGAFPVLPPPGWYPAPGGAGVLQYWNGQHWTDHVAPMAQAGAVGLPVARYVSGLSTGQHIGHGIATVLTCGLWAPFWALSYWLGRRRIS